MLIIFRCVTELRPKMLRADDLVVKKKAKKIQKADLQTIECHTVSHSSEDRGSGH